MGLLQFQKVHVGQTGVSQKQLHTRARYRVDAAGKEVLVISEAFSLVYSAVFL